MHSSVSVGADQIKRFRDSFRSDPLAKIGQNCLCRTSIKDLTVNQRVLQNTDVNVFSHKLDGWGVTNQKKSGRCWLFAMLNLLKRDTAKKLNVKEFEFSQAHIQFFDKLERSNHFLEAMIETSGREIDRTIDYLLQIPIGTIFMCLFVSKSIHLTCYVIILTLVTFVIYPLSRLHSACITFYSCAGDGGQWSMAVNIIKKHGLVPASVFPESDSSGGTLAMNSTLKDLLRTAACAIRRKVQQENASLSDLRVYKDEIMASVWKILSMHLGSPPESFSWDYVDKEGTHRHLADMTPLQFVDQWVDPAFATYVCLVNDPRNPYMQTYTVDYLQVSFVHIPISFCRVV